MGVVELDDVVLRELRKISADRHNKVMYKILQGCRSKEVLLTETQLFSHWSVVVRIKNAADVLRVVLPFDSALVLHVVEELKVKAVRTRRLPETECIDGIVAEPDDRHIIRSGSDFFRVLQIEPVLSVRCLSVFDFTAEFDGYCKVASLYFPRITVAEPVVRIFNLLAVFDVLLEHTVFIADSVSVARILQRCKAVEETGSKTSKTTVAQTCIRLFILDDIEIDAHTLQDFDNQIFYLCINEVVAQCTSHEEFRTQVVQLFCRFFLINTASFHPLRHDDFKRTRTYSVKQVMLRRLAYVFAVLPAETCRKVRLELFCVKYHFILRKRHLLLF